MSPCVSVCPYPGLLEGFPQRSVCGEHSIGPELAMKGRGRADRQGCSGLVFTCSLAFNFCSVVAMTPGVGS